MNACKCRRTGGRVPCTATMEIDKNRDVWNLTAGGAPPAARFHTTQRRNLEEFWTKLSLFCNLVFRIDIIFFDWKVSKHQANIMLLSVSRIAYGFWSSTLDPGNVSRKYMRFRNSMWIFMIICDQCCSIMPSFLLPKMLYSKQNRNNHNLIW